MSDPVVYDKAKYHFGGDYPQGLADEQAYVHTGLYLGWVIERDLYSEMFRAEAAGLIAAFKAREVTGPQAYADWDGCLIDDMLSDEGNAFSAAYFDFERGLYLRDYEELLSRGLPSVYHVADTWENYARLRPRLDARFEAWKQRQRPSPRWRFWHR
jgi:hypothetical protein